MLKQWRKRARARPWCPPANDITARPAKTRTAMFERLEERLVLTVPFGAFPDDTGEFLLGDVAVTVVLFESDGSFNTSTEDWTPELIDNESLVESEKGIKQKVRDGLEWWVDTLRDAETGFAHPLNFNLDFTYTDNPIQTGFEPIDRISNDFSLWVNDFLNEVGFNNSPGVHDDIVAFNHAQREKHDTDWAFTIFVANSTNNFADAFLSGGSFRGAFAFAGGRFFVVPSGRPASTFSHEMGHIFWALDEHHSGASYDAERGYFDTQNLNAIIDNPDPFFALVQSPSIMSSGAALTDAFEDNVSSTMSLQMVGWQDSDGDGVFDIIDVPHALSGSGYYDEVAGKYRFVGESSVQTIPNLNSSGLGNDITINRLSRAQFRLDGEGNPWQDVAALGDSHSVKLDLNIDVPSNFSTIEIRTIDDRTNITSTKFEGGPGAPTSTLNPGINGFIRSDANGDGDLSGDRLGLAGWTVRLVDGGGQPINLTDGVEPDDYPQDTVLNQINPNVTLSAIGLGVENDQVLVRDGNPASTGSKVFRHILVGGAGVSSTWSATSRQLRMDFTSPVTTISLDAISNSNTTTELDYGRLEIYDANDNLLARYTTDGLAAGRVETMTLSRATPDIAYAVARGHAGTAIQFDNLQFGPEASMVTDAQGAYSIPYLLAGTYNVEIVAPDGATITTTASQSVVLAEGEAIGNVDFGAQAAPTPWQNSANPFDIDDNGFVETLDIFKLIDYIRLNGQHDVPLLTAPSLFADVDGDNRIETLDIFALIDFLRQARAGEGEGLNSNDSTVAAEGELFAVEAQLGSLMAGLSSETTSSALSNQSLPNHLLPSQTTSPGGNPTVRPVASTVGRPAGAVLFASSLLDHSAPLDRTDVVSSFDSFDAAEHDNPLSAPRGEPLRFDRTALQDFDLIGAALRSRFDAGRITDESVDALLAQLGADQWPSLSGDPLDQMLSPGLDDSLLERLALDRVGPKT